MSASVQSAPDSKVGGIPTTADAVSFTDQKGNPIRVLLSVGTGKKYAYLTEVVLRDPACQGDLQRAQLVLSSVQYTKKLAATRPLHSGAKGEARSDLYGAAACGRDLMAKLAQTASTTVATPWPTPTQRVAMP